MLAEMVENMKEEVMTSLRKKIDVLEGQLFDKSQENDQLKSEIQKLETHVKEQADENAKLSREIKFHNSERKKAENTLEQYSRSNNIIIGGLPEKPDNESIRVSRNNLLHETARDTTNVVIKNLNHCLAMDLDETDIDIAHRLKRGKKGEKDIIVRLQSRLVKNDIMKHRKALRNAGIYLRDDLSPLNQEIFMSVKRKKQDEVKSVWWQRGSIFYRDRHEEVYRMDWNDYGYWQNLPWPRSKFNVD